MKEINKQNCAFHSKMRLRASMDGRCATSRVMPSHRQATESLFCHCGAEVSLQELPFTKDRNGEIEIWRWYKYHLKKRTTIVNLLLKTTQMLVSAFKTCAFGIPDENHMTRADYVQLPQSGSGLKNFLSASCACTNEVPMPPSCNAEASLRLVRAVCTRRISGTSKRCAN